MTNILYLRRAVKNAIAQILAVLAAMTFATRSAVTSFMFREICPDGFAMKSTAPAERAFIVTCAPSCVRIRT